MSSARRAIGQVRQNHGAAGTEVHVSARLVHRVRHIEIVRDLESAARRGNLDETVAVVLLVRETVRVERGVKRAVGDQGVDVSLRVGRQAAAALPDRAFVAVGSEIEHARLRQGRLVVAHDPGGVRVEVAMRSPARINHAVQKKQRGSFLVLLGIEDDLPSGTVGAGAGIRRLDP